MISRLTPVDGGRTIKMLETGIRTIDHRMSLQSPISLSTVEWCDRISNSRASTSLTIGFSVVTMNIWIKTHDTMALEGSAGVWNSEKEEISSYITWTYCCTSHSHLGHLKARIVNYVHQGTFSSKINDGSETVSFFKRARGILKTVKTHTFRCENVISWALSPLLCHQSESKCTTNL